MTPYISLVETEHRPRPNIIPKTYETGTAISPTAIADLGREDGVSALDACCACGGGKRHAFKPASKPEGCIDRPWRDSGGLKCSDYEESVISLKKAGAPGADRPACADGAPCFSHA